MSILIGLGIDYAPIDPIKALFWCAVLNGMIAVPIMIATMIVATRRDAMGEFVATRAQLWLGWTAAAVMAAAAAAMLILR